MTNRVCLNVSVLRAYVIYSNLGTADLDKSIHYGTYVNAATAV